MIGNLNKLLNTLADAFGEVSRRRRDLEDECAHAEDRKLSRMRSLVCMDIAEALHEAATQLEIEQPVNVEAEMDKLQPSETLCVK
jgi:uncharacterized protein YjcR